MQERYVLGHSARELDRLDLQGALYREITTRALTRAGLGSGMSVLDIGCGSGDVTRLAGQLVGRSGSVLGVDRDEGAVVAARARAEAEGCANVTFEVAEVGAPTTREPFDALVGRFVLMHQPDPGRTLAAAARCVRPGGLAVMLESNMASLLDAPHSEPPSPLYDQVVRWKCEVVRAAGADLRAGLHLRRTFREAGLPEPALRMEIPVEGGASSPIYHYMAESCRSMLAEAKRCGIAGLDEEDVNSLEERLRAETVANDGVLLAWPVVSAWCRTSRVGLRPSAAVPEPPGEALA